jgi:MFS family permease
MYGVLFLIPFYLENVQGLHPSATGFLLTPVPIAMAILTPYAGTLADRFNPKHLTFVGMGFATIGTLLFCFVSATSSTVLLVIGLILIGIGQGVFTPPNNSTVMGSVPHHLLGSAGGLLNMSRSLGMSVGIAFSGAVYQLALTFSADQTQSPTNAQMLHAFHYAFFATGLLSICAMILIPLRRAKSLANESTLQA